MSGVTTAVVVGGGAVLGALGNYLGAKSQAKAAREAAKPKPYVTYKTPYMNEYMSIYAPWLMAQQQKIYASRLKQYGLEPPDFGPMAELLAQINPAYSGVGQAGQAPVLNQPLNYGSMSPFGVPYSGQVGGSNSAQYMNNLSGFYTPQPVMARQFNPEEGANGGSDGRMGGFRRAY